MPQNNKQKVVDVAPDISMYDILKKQTYRPAWAIAEFIDNSIQAYLNLPKSAQNDIGQLLITLKYYTPEFDDKNKKNSLEIFDNGAGITEAELIAAYQPMKKSNKEGLNEFGIGMKSAAVWLAESWELQTIPYSIKGKKDIHKVKFDLEEIKAHGNTQLPIQNINKSIDGLTKSGVKISLNNLERILNDCIFTDISEIYQRFTIGKGAPVKIKLFIDDTPEDEKITFNDKGQADVLFFPKAITIDDPDGNTHYCAIGAAKDWKIKIKFQFKNKLVTGFICQREQGSYKTNPGFRLFRYNRVIKGTANNDFMPLTTVNKFAAQRLYAELNMDGLPVDYNKEDFLINFDTFLDKIYATKGFDTLLDQASKYSAQAIKGHAKKKYEYFKTEKEARKKINDKNFKGNPKNKAGTVNPTTSTSGHQGSSNSNSIPAGNNTNSHVDHWTTLLPADFPTTEKDSDILNSFISEATTLELSVSHASSMLYRSLIESSLKRFIKITSKFPDVKNYFYSVGKGKKKNHSEEYKKAQGLTMEMMVDWLVAHPDNFPTEDRARLKAEVKKLNGKIQTLNGVVHCEKLIAKSEITTIRNDTIFLLKFLVSYT